MGDSPESFSDMVKRGIAKQDEEDRRAVEREKYDRERQREYQRRQQQEQERWQARMQQVRDQLTAPLQQDAARLAAVARRRELPRDVILGWLFPRAVGWVVWVGIPKVESWESGKYSPSVSTSVDGLILLSKGRLCTASGGTIGYNVYEGDPRTLLRQPHELREVQVESEKEVRDLRQKLVEFAVKHRLQV